MPIGTEANLRSFHCDAARRFYQTWYRPDLMAVLAVGDFDADAMVRTIRERFSDLKNPDAPVPRTRYHISLDDPPLTVVHADSERTRSTVWIIDRAEDRWAGDHTDFASRGLDGLIGDIFTERFEQLTEDPASPMVEASIWTESLAWERGNHLAWATPKEGREAEAMAALFTEIERARRFGFTEAEVSRARAETLSWLRSAYDERDKSDHVDAIEELVRVFLVGESAPGIAYEYAFARRALPKVTAAQLSDRFRTAWFQGRARGLSALLTDKPGLTPPTVAELDAIPRAVADAPLTPFPAPPPPGPLVRTPPKPGTAEPIGEDPEYGLSTWALSNGATLLLMPTEHQDDEVLFQGWSPGGHGLVPASELIAAMSAASVLGNSGFGELSPSQVSRALAGKDASAWASLGELYEGLGGNASAKELDTLLQLVWLRAAQPRFTEDGFALTVQQYTESLANRRANPDLVFEDAWQRLVWGDDPRRDPWDLTDLPAMNRATSERIWRERFADFSDWTFLIVGNITPGKAVRSAERWLASLPATGAHEAWRDNGSRRVDGVHRLELPRGGTDRARVQIVFHGDIEPTLGSWDQLHGLAELIDLRLRETLREELGGVYGPSASAGMRYLPTGTYTLTVRFECAPDRLAELEAAAWAVVERVRTEPATEDEVAAIREQARRDHETSLTSNQTWQQTVYAARINGWSLHDAVEGWEARNAAKTPASLQASAKALLNRERVFVGVLKP
jgi:zinc protease